MDRRAPTESPVFTNTAFKTGLTRNLRCCAPQRGHWPHLSEDGIGFAAEPGLRQLPRAGEAGTRQWHGVAHVRPVSCLFSITTLASPLLRAAEHLPEWRVDPRQVHLTHGSYGSISLTQNAHWQKSENFPCLRTFQGADAFCSMPPTICIYGPPCGSFREIPYFFLFRADFCIGFRVLRSVSTQFPREMTQKPREMTQKLRRMT